MIVCGFEDVREHKPAVSGKNPVHPVHRCESKIYPCLTMNRFPATRRRRLFQASRAPALPCGSYESETGVIQARCQFLSNPCCFNLLNRFCVTRTQVLFQISRAPALPGGSFEGETTGAYTYREQGPCPVIWLAASLNIDTQDRQDKQDEKLLHKKLIGSIIECAFVENLSVLRGPSRTPFESIPTP